MPSKERIDFSFICPKVFNKVLLQTPSTTSILVFFALCGWESTPLRNIFYDLWQEWILLFYNELERIPFTFGMKMKIISICWNSLNLRYVGSSWPFSISTVHNYSLSFPTPNTILICWGFMRDWFLYLYSQRSHNLRMKIS